MQKSLEYYVYSNVDIQKWISTSLDPALQLQNTLPVLFIICINRVNSDFNK